MKYVNMLRITKKKQSQLQTDQFKQFKFIRLTHYDTMLNRPVHFISNGSFFFIKFCASNRKYKPTIFLLLEDRKK